MKVMFHKPDDRDEYFNVLLSHSNCLLYPKSNSSYNNGSSLNTDEEYCSYDPFKTADLIEKIVNIGCVDRVFVPDVWLVKKLEGMGGKLLYKPFVEEDRFFVEFPSDPCAERGTK